MARRHPDYRRANGGHNALHGDDVFPHGSGCQSSGGTGLGDVSFLDDQGLQCLTFEAYNVGPGTAINILTNSPLFPTSPRERLLMTSSTRASVCG
jgi:hypothetical protein